MRKAVLCLLCAICIPNVAARADIVEFTPFLQLNEEYNDNSFFTSRDEVDDFITTLSPGIRGKWAAERYKTTALGRIDARSYSNTSALNAVDQEYRGTFRYNLTPKASMNSNLSFKRDARPDRDVEETGLVLGTSRRDRIQFGMGGAYNLNEKTTLSADYDLLRDEFDDPESSDYNTHVIVLGAIHNFSYLSDQTFGRMHLGYYRYNFIGSRTQTYALTLGMEKRLSEVYGFKIDVGSRYSYTQSWFFQPEITADKWGGVGKGTFYYKGETTDWNISFSHDLQAASGRNGATERTSLSFFVKRKITAELSGRLKCEYFMNDTESTSTASSDIDTETLRILPHLRYAFSPDLALVASYKFTYLDDNTRDESKERNQFILQLEYKFPVND